jgi:hypothetical protein
MILPNLRKSELAKGRGENEELCVPSSLSLSSGMAQKEEGGSEANL